MKKLSFPAIALSVVLSTSVALPVAVMAPTEAHAAKQAKQKRFSREVYTVINDVAELMEEGKLQEALALTLEGAQIEDMEPHEAYAIQDYLGRIYFELIDYPKAAAAFDAAYATGAVQDEIKEGRLSITTQLYLQSENYPKAIEFADHYINQVGPTAQMLSYKGQAQYLSKQLSDATGTLKQAMNMADAAGEDVPENWIRYIEHAYAEQKNLAGVINAEKELVRRYPNEENWSGLLTNFSISVKGSDKATLDIYRLMLATNVLTRGIEYEEMARLALDAGFPAEAKNIMDKGFASGTLGTGPAKKDHEDLRKDATATAAQDAKNIDRDVKEAAAMKTGDADVRFGEAYWGYGRHDDAINVIQQGLSKGVKNMDDAQLRLGLAYLGAGQNDQAIKAFWSMTSNSPEAQVAEIWAIYAETTAEGDEDEGAAPEPEAAAEAVEE